MGQSLYQISVSLLKTLKSGEPEYHRQGVSSHYSPDYSQFTGSHFKHQKARVEIGRLAKVDVSLLPFFRDLRLSSLLPTLASPATKAAFAAERLRGLSLPEGRRRSERQPLARLPSAAVGPLLPSQRGRGGAFWVT